MFPNTGNKTSTVNAAKDCNFTTAEMRYIDKLPVESLKQFVEDPKAQWGTRLMQANLSPDRVLRDWAASKLTIYKDYLAKLKSGTPTAQTESSAASAAKCMGGVFNPNKPSDKLYANPVYEGFKGAAARAHSPLSAGGRNAVDEESVYENIPADDKGRVYENVNIPADDKGRVYENVNIPAVDKERVYGNVNIPAVDKERVYGNVNIPADDKESVYVNAPPVPQKTGPVYVELDFQKVSKDVSAASKHKAESSMSAEDEMYADNTMYAEIAHGQIGQAPEPVYQNYQRDTTYQNVGVMVKKDGASPSVKPTPPTLTSTGETFRPTAAPRAPKTTLTPTGETSKTPTTPKLEGGAAQMSELEKKFAEMRLKRSDNS
ncbi:hypothetical protein [Shewanella waksmanii]|uniref:hypothetical protein n=1 Tax=Shewanella waksmanii TaxID=213783 RepID=UPI003734CB22